VRLMIVGSNEVLGLEEILVGTPKWSTTITCYSSTARAYFFEKDDFIRLLRQHVLDERVLLELALKRRLNH